MRRRRCSTRSGELMLRTDIVARAIGVVPTSVGPFQWKCSVHMCVLGLKRDVNSSVTGSYPAMFDPLDALHWAQRDTGSPARFDHDAFGQGYGRFHAATRCMSAEAGSIRSGPLLAAAPGPASTASGSARLGERQARLGLHQIDELAYAEVFLQFRVLSITNFPSIIRIK